MKALKTLFESRAVARLSHKLRERETENAKKTKFKAASIFISNHSGGRSYIHRRTVYAGDGAALPTRAFHLPAFRVAASPLSVVLTCVHVE